MDSSDAERAPLSIEDLQSWLTIHDHAENPLIPAATVIVVRDTPGGIETLMMRRSADLSFAEGMWVFPGGRIDDGDHPDAEPDEPAAARRAAVRETKEEADLDLAIDSLEHFSHWVPPVQAPKRFSTWFFLAPAPSGAVTIDDSEIVDHEWCRPVDALDYAASGRLSIMPPTWVSLHQLQSMGSVDEALAHTAAKGPQVYATRIVRSPAGIVSVWEPDAAYDNGKLETNGRRHRLTMSEGRWTLERS